MAVFWRDVVRHCVGHGGMGFGLSWFGLGVIGPVGFMGLVAFWADYVGLSFWDVGWGIFG